MSNVVNPGLQYPGVTTSLPWTNNGDTVYYTGSAAARLAAGSTGQVLTIAGGVPSWASPSGSSPVFIFSASQPSQVNSTIGYFVKAANVNGNPALGYPLMTNSSPGIVNPSNCDPFHATRAISIRTLTCTVAHISTGVATATTPCNMQIDIYTIGYNSNSLLGTVQVPLGVGAGGTIGVYNNLSLNNYQTVTVSGLNLALAAGQLFGFIFTNNSGAGAVNGFQGAWISLEAW